MFYQTLVQLRVVRKEKEWQQSRGHRAFGSDPSLVHFPVCVCVCV